MKRSVFLLSFVLIVTSCATPYQAANFVGGFSETQLDIDLFTISFNGNGYTSSERASDFALLRCADLSLENNYLFFKIIDSQSNIKTTYSVTTDSNYDANSFGRSIYGNSTSRTNVQTIEKPTISITIRLLKEKADGTYSASFISKSIRAKYSIKK